MRDLSNTILFETDDDVKRLLDAGVSVDAHDAYGTTPLINTILAGKPHLFRMLLDQGADPEFADRSGNTPLYWAIENSQFVATQALLKQGANPNAYNAFGQPVSAYAVLRKAQPYLDLLTQHGADLKFAEDFIETKLMGHRFELEGVNDIYAPGDHRFVEVSFEGFYLEFTLGILHDSLTQFARSPAFQKKLADRTPLLEAAVAALAKANRLRRLNARFMNRSMFQEEIDALMASDPLIIPVSYQGHAITFVRHKNYLTHCDRGENSKVAGSVTLYQMQRPERFTLKFIENLLFGKHDALYINLKLQSELGLQVVDRIPTESQITGNCSWANVEASIPALMTMVLWAQAEEQGLTEKKERIKLREHVLWVHAAWLNWDKDEAIKHCMKRFQERQVVARKISMATILGAVFFQRLNASSPKDISRAKAMLKILNQPDYRYILGSYADIYTQSPQARTQPLSQNFIKLLKACGHKPGDFIKP